MTEASVLNFRDCFVKLDAEPRERDLSSNMLVLGLALWGVVGVTGELAERKEDAEGILDELAWRDHHCCFGC